MSKNIKMNIDQDGIAVIEIDVQDRPMNVITVDFADDFKNCIEQVLNDEKVIGAVVTSAKNDFMAGADLKTMLPSLIGLGDASAMAEKVIQSHKVNRAMETGGKPFVAAINGTALGGGLEITLSCHHRIAADRKDAVLGLSLIHI